MNTIKSATQALNESMQKIGQAVYSKQQQPPPGSQPPPPGGQQGGPGGQGGQGGQGPSGEGTVEGEFREV
jgi:hypothetical protein